MPISDLIREATTEHEIYFLLTAYIESVRYGDNLGLLPDRITRLPLNGAPDLRDRFSGLLIDLDAASRGLNEKFCTVIKEALQVFGAGIARLRFIDDAHRQALMHAMRSLSEKQAQQTSDAPQTYRAAAQTARLLS